MKKSRLLIVLFVVMALLASQVGTVFAASKSQDASQNPVASALAMFFSDITDYDSIMTAHDNGVGFGVIAQALWLTTQMEGNPDDFAAILEAKQTGDYSGFTFEDGTKPTNWGQFKKALAAGDKKENLGMIISAKNKDKNNTGNGQDKSNNGNGQEKGKTNNGNNGNQNK